ncbi:MAG: hypothetical protein ACRDIV_19985 [Ktedonobacteraceae bacterium]
MPQSKPPSQSGQWNQPEPEQPNQQPSRPFIKQLQPSEPDQPDQQQLSQPQWQQPQYSQPPEAYYPPTQPQLPRKRMRRQDKIAVWFIAALVIVSAMIVISIIATGGAPANNASSNGQTTSTGVSVHLTATDVSFQQTAVAASNSLTPIDFTQTPIVTNVPVTPVPTFATFADGTFQVGSDIQPGTYRTQSGSSGCYYARLKGFSGTIDDILSNNNTDDPAIVTILPSDKGFESQNCGTWTKDLSQITTSKTTFDDGMYIIGTDIEPGTYKNAGSSGCYYARLSGFTGTIDSIIANNNTDAPAIITIAASDKGFESTRCGMWTKL